MKRSLWFAIRDGIILTATLWCVFFGSLHALAGGLTFDDSFWSTQVVLLNYSVSRSNALGIILCALPLLYLILSVFGSRSKS